MADLDPGADKLGNAPIVDDEDLIAKNPRSPVPHEGYGTLGNGLPWEPDTEVYFEGNDKWNGIIPHDWQELREKPHESGKGKWIGVRRPGTPYLTSELPWEDNYFLAQSMLKSGATADEILKAYGVEQEAQAAEPMNKGVIGSISGGRMPAGGGVSKDAPEKVTAATIRLDGKTYTGPNHADLSMKYENEILRAKKIEEGFATNKRDFIPREEAMKMADKQGQITERMATINSWKDKLMSEQVRFEIPKHLEDTLTKHAQGRVTSQEVKSAFKEAGWRVDLRRGRTDYEVYDPNGNHMYIQP